MWYFVKCKAQIEIGGRRQRRDAPPLHIWEVVCIWETAGPGIIALAGGEGGVGRDLACSPPIVRVLTEDKPFGAKIYRR